ncbi:MAG: hypothetical protein L3K16_08440 [Thermoplasmata archaeon]|nr:hypothetical protein [Thermoplasmata archaeon]
MRAGPGLRKLAALGAVVTLLLLPVVLSAVGTVGYPGAGLPAPTAAGSANLGIPAPGRLPAHPAPAASYPRTVLVEAFTGVWCIHCPAESQALFNLSRNESPNVLAVAELHVCAFAPGSGPCLDSYEPADNTSAERGSFYDVCGYPDVFFDGEQPTCGATNSASQMESEYSAAISNASNFPGNVSIVQAASFTPGGVTDLADVNSSITGSFNAITYLVEYIGKQNVSNGYGPHEIGWVVRETLENHPVTLTAGTWTAITALGSLNSSWNPANLSVITFVQQNSTRIIENANLALVTNRSARFSLAFDETGLPAGTPWSVDLNGTRLNGTGSSLRSSGLPPGTYNFTASASGYRANVGSTNRSSGAVTVDTPNETVGVTFVLGPPELFPLIFHESGLPAGTGWGVLLGSGSETSFSQNVTYAESNGSYGYVVLSPSGYVTTYPGPATVNGSPTVVPVTFHPQTYPIVFIEFGLPAGSNWSVTVSNRTTGFNSTESSVTSSIIFFLPNGTYQIAFTLPPGYAGNASATNLSVAGTSGSGPVVHAQGPTARAGTSPGSAGPWMDAMEWIALGAGGGHRGGTPDLRHPPPARKASRAGGLGPEPAESDRSRKAGPGDVGTPGITFPAKSVAPPRP